LPNNVRSIALECDTDLVTTNWTIYDILACHDWKVTPNSIVPGWSSFATEAYGDNWYDPTVAVGPVDIWGWISDTKLTFLPKAQNATSPTQTANCCWPFDAFSGTVYVYHHLAPNLWQNSNNNTVEGVTEAGTAALPVVCSGGWNRTDMSTQTGVTFLHNLNGIGNHFGTGRAYVKYKRFYVSGYQFAATVGEEMVFEECGSVGNTIPRFGPAIGSDRPCMMKKLYLGGAVNGILAISGLAEDIKVTTNLAVYISQGGYINRIGFFGQSMPTFNAGNGRNKYSIGKLYSRDAAIAVTRANGSSVSCEYFYPTNVTLVDAAGNSSGFFGICRYNGTYNDCRGYGQWMSWIRDTAIVHSPATASMKIGVNNSGAREDFPLTIPLLDHEFSTDPTGQTVTISVWVYRSSTNIGLKLVVCPGMIVNTRQSATAAGSAGSWEHLTITFTANLYAAVGLFAELWATDSVSFAYISFEDISITKA
jgi:hypothetical protein